MLRPVLLMLPLALAACVTEADTDTAASAGSPATLLPQGQEWRIVKASGIDTPADTVATLTRTADGVAGSGGCNRYFGSATITEDTLKFGELGSTMMACLGPSMQYERHVHDALKAADGVTGTPGGTLTLTAKGQPVAQLEPHTGG